MVVGVKKEESARCEKKEWEITSSQEISSLHGLEKKDRDVYPRSPQSQ